MPKIWNEKYKQYEDYEGQIERYVDSPPVYDDNNPERILRCIFCKNTIIINGKRFCKITNKSNLEDKSCSDFTFDEERHLKRGPLRPHYVGDIFFSKDWDKNAPKK